MCLAIIFPQASWGRILVASTAVVDGRRPCFNNALLAFAVALNSGVPVALLLDFPLRALPEVGPFARCVTNFRTVGTAAQMARRLDSTQLYPTNQFPL